MVPDSLSLPLPDLPPTPPAPAARPAPIKRGGRSRRRGGARVQGDLFSFPRRPRPAVIPEAAPEDAPADVPAPDDLESLPTVDVIGRLDALLDEDRPALVAFVALADALGARADKAATPVLLRLAHRFAGFDRDAGAPEMRAALAALGRLNDPACASVVTDLATLDALSPESLALALECLAGLRHRQAAPLARLHLTHESPAVRAAACTLAARLRLRPSGPALEALLTDPVPSVAAAAALALGSMGLPAGKAPLETWLSTAAPLDLPRIIAALAPVADDDTAVLLGRAAERADLDGRLAVVTALGDIGGRAAVTWLCRLARDRKPTVRRMVAEALEKCPDPASAPILRELAADEDAAVADAAEQTLQALAEQAEDW